MIISYLKEQIEYDPTAKNRGFFFNLVFKAFGEIAEQRCSK